MMLSETPPFSRSPLRFFLLVAVLSVPFAALGTLTDRQLYPGIPISALAFVCPVTAALLLAWRTNGIAGARAVLGRALDASRIGSKLWYAPVLLLMPCVTLGAYAVLRTTGAPLRPPEPLRPGTVLLFVVFLVAALGEELGWSGYVLDPLQERWGALGAALLLGAVWAGWHVIAMVQAGQSASWIAWGCLDMVATRVLMVWIYDNTGRSVFAVALYHAVANLSIKTLFPGGSFQAERTISLILTCLAAAVTIAWGPGLAARWRRV